MFLSGRRSLLVGICVAVATSRFVDAFMIENSRRNGFQNKFSLFGQESDSLKSVPENIGDDVSVELSRRKMMAKTAALASLSFLPAAIGSPASSSAAVGTLPEFSDTNAIINGLTVNVADASQQQAMIDFLTGAFDFVVQRQRIQGTVEETWLGFGPEQLSVPKDFELPVSSFSRYGGHAAINVRYDSQAVAPLYKVGDEAPGNSIAYLACKSVERDICVYE